jgi:hypothetical protein
MMKATSRSKGSGANADTKGTPVSATKKPRKKPTPRTDRKKTATKISELDDDTRGKHELASAIGRGVTMRPSGKWVRVYAVANLTPCPTFLCCFRSNRIFSASSKTTNSKLNFTTRDNRDILVSLSHERRLRLPTRLLEKSSRVATLRRRPEKPLKKPSKPLERLPLKESTKPGQQRLQLLVRAKQRRCTRQRLLLAQHHRLRHLRPQPRQHIATVEVP